MRKKALSILFASAMITGFVSCGMSEEEQKADSMQQDSVINETEDATQRMIDSMDRENAKADSIAKADSARKADSAANATKK